MYHVMGIAQKAVLRHMVLHAERENVLKKGDLFQCHVDAIRGMSEITSKFLPVSDVYVSLLYDLEDIKLMIEMEEL